MRRIVGPLLVAVVLAALAFGPGRQYLPGALRLQTGGSLVSNEDMSGMDDAEGHPSGIGLAPAPIVDPPAGAGRLTVTVKPAAKEADGYLLAVRLAAPDGKPVADAPVRFFDVVDLFGPREMLIATDTTDGRGDASYEYLPATSGTHRIVVRSAGQGPVRAAEARTTFEATVTATAPHSDRAPFASFSDRVPYAVGALVLGVWGLIAFALLATARGVMAGARSTRRKEGTA